MNRKVQFTPAGHPATVLALVLAMTLTLALPTAQAAARRHRTAPVGFFGMGLDSSMLDQPGARDREYALMAQSGVESVRASFFWGAIQPRRGGPFDFRYTDAIVLAAARHGIGVLPVLVGTPEWDATTPNRPFGISAPRDISSYAAFVSAAVRRYGPHGSFWRAHRRLRAIPVRRWQVWNEPSLDYFWYEYQTFPRRFVELARAGYLAIKRLDRRAQVVLAGLPNDSWHPLEAIYAAGGRRWFDAVAIHPYAGAVEDVILIVERDRDVMARHGDARKPVLITEFSWSSGNGRTLSKYATWDVSEAEQARRLTAAYRAFLGARRRLRIEATYWFTWLSPPPTSNATWSLYAGLRELRASGGARSKPALGAYRRAALSAEGCLAKTTATRCSR